MGLAERVPSRGSTGARDRSAGPLLAEDTSAISPRVLLAWCLEEAGRSDEALAAMIEVHGLDPANPFARPARPITASAGGVGFSGGETQAEPERALTPDELARVPPSPLYSATPRGDLRASGLRGEGHRDLLSASCGCIPTGKISRARIVQLQTRIAGDAVSREVLVLFGPNLALLGRREVDVYGTVTADEIRVALEKRARDRGRSLSWVVSNHEGGASSTR